MLYFYSICFSRQKNFVQCPPELCLRDSVRQSHHLILSNVKLSVTLSLSKGIEAISKNLDQPLPADLPAKGIAMQRLLPANLFYNRLLKSYIMQNIKLYLIIFYFFCPFSLMRKNETCLTGKAGNQENPKLLTHLLSHARRIFRPAHFSCSAGIRLAELLLKYSYK